MKIKDEDFVRVSENSGFIDGDYNILILDDDKTFVKTLNVFGESKIGFDIALLCDKPKDILNLPITGLVTEDGVLIKVTDSAVCERIAEMLRESKGIEEGSIIIPDGKELVKVWEKNLLEKEQPEEPDTKEIKRNSPKAKRPSIEGWPIVCYRNRIPIYLPLLESIEKLYLGEEFPDQQEISDAILGAYNGDITESTALSHSYKYRAVALERLKKRGIPIDKLRKRGMRIAVLHPDWKRLAEVNGIGIYDEVVARIKPLCGQGGELALDSVVVVIRELYGDHLEVGTAFQYASSYMRYLREDAIREDVVREEEGTEEKEDLDDRESTVLCYEPPGIVQAEEPKLLKRRTHPEKTLLCRHNNTRIYDTVLALVLKSPDSLVSDIQDIIREEYSESLKPSSALKYAYDYKHFIDIISVDEVEKIYAKLPESFNVANVRAYIPTRFSQSEKRADVTKLVIAKLITQYNCEEVSEGAFIKGKDDDKRA